MRHTYTPYARDVYTILWWEYCQYTYIWCEQGHCGVEVTESSTNLRKQQPLHCRAYVISTLQWIRPHHHALMRKRTLSSSICKSAPPAAYTQEELCLLLLMCSRCGGVGPHTQAELKQLYLLKQQNKSATTLSQPLRKQKRPTIKAKETYY